MRRLVVFAALLLAACQFGSRQQNFAPARTGLGAQIRLLGSERSTVRGELLEVSDSQLLFIRSDRRLTVARFANLRHVTMDQLGVEYTWYPTMRDQQAWRRQARLVARYPQGLTAEQRQQLLAASGQVALDTLR